MQTESANHSVLMQSRRALTFNHLDAFADDFLELSQDRRYIRRKFKYQRRSAAEQGFCKATKAVELSLQLVSGSKHVGVLVPADVRYHLHIFDCNASNIHK